MKIDSGYLIVSEEERKMLKSEFEQLITIEQKYDFWKNKFGLNYSFNHRDDIQEHTFTEFLIQPKDSDETEILNKRIYDDFKKSVPDFSEKTLASKWEEQFENEFKLTPDKNDFVEFELRKIDDFISDKKKPVKGFKQRIPTVPYSNQMFLEGYEQYIKFKKGVNFRERLFNPYDLKELLHGIEFAQYREFVKNYSAKEKNTPEIKLTGEEKFLILHYLGFGNEVKANTKKSVLYDFFIDELNSKSIRPMFSDIKKYETEKNLNTIIDFFRFIKLDSKAREIKDRLEKLHKKR